MSAELYLLRALEQAVIRRHATEPRHSREDHECSECEVLSALRGVRLPPPNDPEVLAEMMRWERASDEDHRRVEGLIDAGQKLREHLSKAGVTEEQMLREFEEWRKKRRVNSEETRG